MSRRNENQGVLDQISNFGTKAYNKASSLFSSIANTVKSATDKLGEVITGDEEDIDFVNPASEYIPSKNDRGTSNDYAYIPLKPRKLRKEESEDENQSSENKDGYDSVEKNVNFLFPSL